MIITSEQWNKLWKEFPGDYTVNGTKLHESSMTKNNFFGSILHAKWTSNSGLAIRAEDIDRVEENNIILRKQKIEH